MAFITRWGFTPRDWRKPANNKCKVRSCKNASNLNGPSCKYHWFATPKSMRPNARDGSSLITWIEYWELKDATSGVDRMQSQRYNVPANARGTSRR